MAEYQGGNETVIASQFQPLFGILQNNYHRRQKQEAEENKAREKVMSEVGKDLYKTNSAGIREVDLPEFYQNINTAKQKYFEMSKAKGEERAKLELEFRGYLGEAERIKELSKGAIQSFNNADKTVINMVGKGEYDKASTYLKELRNKKSSELAESSFDLTNYYDKYDENKMRTSMNDLAKAMLNDPKLTTPTFNKVHTERTSGGALYDYVDVSRTVNDEALLQGISDLVETNRDWKAYVTSQVNEGMEYNDVIAGIVEQYADRFSEVKTERLKADKSQTRKGVTVNNIQMPQSMENKQKSLKIGLYETDRAWTYNREVGLQGETEFYDPYTGDLITTSRSTLDFKGYNIMVLPVDEGGSPIPEGSSRRAVGEAEFLTGRVLNPDSSLPEEAYPSDIRAMMSRDVLIPSTESDFISMPKTQREIITAIENQSSRAPKGGKLR